ncbi:MAG: LLM class flavin-dependent oxidoreductase [Candidatus Tectomicrobia bacterium]|nr:LLM class flavin-dependent oxidoreductase [Candidatus Tectomicrobia bacterium]
MRFGYFTLTDNPPAYGAARRDPNALLNDVHAECILAEELGFNSVWVPEHHFGLFGCLPTPAVYLAHLAAKTSRIRLAPATVLLPCNQPLRVAEEYAMLDLLSNGRAIFSAGRGYDRREYDAFEIPFDESRARFDEEMHLVRKALMEENFTFEGKFHRVAEPLTIVPRPIQHPHPPIYVACFSRPTVEMAARGGFNAIFAPFAATMMFGSVQEATSQFQAMAQEAGHQHSRVMCSYFFSLADNDAETLQAKERLLHYLHAILPAFPDDRRTAPPHIAYFVDIVERLRAMTPEGLGERSIVTGNLDQCLKTLKSVEAAGIEEVILYFNFGGYSHSDTIRMMERFAKEVMPHFNNTPARRLVI